MSKKRSRNAGQPLRFQDFVSVEEPKRNSKVLYSITLHSNDEEQVVPLSQLEDLNGLSLTKKDATIDTEVIWMHKGKTPYEATIVGIHTDRGKPEELALNPHPSNKKGCSEDMDLSVKQTGKANTSIKESEDDVVPTSESEEDETETPTSRSSTPKAHGRKNGLFPESSDEEEPPNKKSRTVGSLFTSADRDLLVRIEKRLEHIECFLKKSDKQDRAPLQPSVSIHSKSSCKSKQSLQLKQPLPDLSLNDTSSSAGPSGSSNNLECLPGSTPAKYALNLMDAFFTEEEMNGHLFIKSQRSKSVRELLPQDNVKKILSYVTERFGKEETRKEFKTITDACNQKCRDKDKKFRDDKENLMAEFDL